MRRNPSGMTLEEAKIEVKKIIYLASYIFEDFEFVGKIRGNGHHARQHLAKIAAEMLEKRWIK